VFEQAGFRPETGAWMWARFDDRVTATEAAGHARHAGDNSAAGSPCGWRRGSGTVGVVSAQKADDRTSHQGHDPHEHERRKKAQP
jgi:hypothetical protein